VYQLSVWDLDAGKESWRVATIPYQGLRSDSGRSLYFSRDGSRMAGLKVEPEGQDKLTVWETASGKELLSRGYPTRGVQSLALSSDGKLLATAWCPYFPVPVQPDREVTLTVVDVESGKELLTPQKIQLGGGAFETPAVQFNPDGSRIYLGIATGFRATGKLYAWDLATGKAIPDVD